MDAEQGTESKLSDLLSKIEVGLPLQLMPEGHSAKNASYTVYVRGWEEHTYIVTTLPERDAQKLPLRSGLRVTGRLIAGGIAFGFRTRILEMLHRPVTLMLLKFPANIAYRDIRAHKRIPVFLMAEFVINADKGDSLQKTGAGTLLDLAVGGCCLECDEEINIGTRLQLSFALPSGETVEGITAEVMNQRTQAGRNRCGLRFMVERSPEAAHLIEQFFQSSVPD